MKSEILKLTEISLSTNQTDNYIIYGTGEIGRMLKKVLYILNQKVSCFLCSTGYKSRTDIDGIPVYDMDEYLQLINKNNLDKILLTVQGGKEQIIYKLKKNTKNIIFQINSPQDVCSMYGYYYKRYFSQRDIDVNREYLKLKGIEFINPFYADLPYALAFFMECGDLILPAIFDDLSCIQDGPYEVSYVSVKSDDIVLDCGSNLGLFSIVVSGRCNKVYAFEPVPDTNKYICEASRIHKNMELVDKALGSYTGKVKFSMQRNLNFSNRILPESDKKEDTFINSDLVDIITIDEFVKEYGLERVDFIKSDIEGAERDMLRGAVQTLKKYAPKLSICEYHLPDDPEILEKIILDANPNYVINHNYLKLYAYVP